MMAFESLEDDVPTWIGFIDKWAAAANARYEEWQATQQRGSGESPNPRDRERKLGELNEKFKNL